jgi:hypothetical protein
MKILAGSLLFAASAIVSVRAADPLSSLRAMTGTWNCTYNTGKTTATYKAVFSYEMSGNWLRERDSWVHGGSDEGLFTYEPKRSAWTEIVVEPDRTTTIFRGPGANPNHIVYRSIYPDASMTDVFDRTSPARYSLHFTQAVDGKTIASVDTCVKT